MKSMTKTLKILNKIYYRQLSFSTFPIDVYLNFSSFIFHTHTIIHLSPIYFSCLVFSHFSRSLIIKLTFTDLGILEKGSQCVAQDEIIMCIANDKQGMTFRGIPEGGNGKKAKENWMTSWLLFLFHASSGFSPYHIPSAVCKYCIQH